MDNDSSSHTTEVTVEAEAWCTAVTDPERLCRRAVACVLASEPASVREGVTPVEVSVLLTGDDRLRELNRDFRGQDHATNVLSFPAGEPVPTLQASGVFPLGDIAVALETAAREARVEGKTLDDHLTHLIVHGTLHLLGYDHEQDAEEAERMERREVEILAGLGVADPYRVEAAA